jgi:hypothetical protein
MKVLPMFIISMLAALLSSMSVWADKWDDVRLSLNDFYMAFLMTGWMFLLEGMMMFHGSYILGGTALILVSFLCIRFQVFVDIQQYVRGMIPHHSMAILMSKKLIAKYGAGVLGSLPQEIIKTQESEILYLKKQEDK